ncbi:hypothetical protein B0H14DRAFT_2606585 [Mycena olivaceomarginata]|nr:hypothetical protein B0H14DRAFT_2632559 [Mycena olivaceomarginata]KAJ7811439.1 hypothetical protein B0H14DRAFT_2606585 [Mycena olivaceomarginata]
MSFWASAFFSADDILPELEPVSDDEDNEDNIQADDEHKDNPADHIGNAPGPWDDKLPFLCQAWLQLTLDDQEMPFEPYEAPRLSRPAPSDPSPSPTSTSSPPTSDPWCFGFAADLDDKYLEEYSGQNSGDDNNQYNSMDDEPEHETVEGDKREYIFTAPSIEEAQAALKSINNLLRPPCNKGAGYKKCTLHLYRHTRLE